MERLELFELYQLKLEASELNSVVCCLYTLPIANVGVGLHVHVE